MVTPEMICVPVTVFVPLHPSDAKQVVTFVPVHDSVTLPPDATVVGLALIVSVGVVLDPETVTATVFVTVPPVPVQLNV